MAQTQVRVPGGGNTYVKIGLDSTHVVEFLSRLRETPPSSKGNPVAIQGIGDVRPVEVALPYAQGHGVLNLTVWQRWGVDGWVSAFMSRTDNGTGSDGSNMWDAFINRSDDDLPEQMKHRGSNRYPVDLVEVYNAQRMNPEYVKVQQVELGANGEIARIKNYNGCVITNVSAASDLDNNTMEAPVQIEIWYTSFDITYV